MLSDVVDKLRDGSEVPSYLKEAISDHVGESHRLYNEVTMLLSRI
ncbi:MAG: hypothetical protein P8X57_11525 [Cyclobacteriaceae bacterium]